MVSQTKREVVAADYREVGCTRICQTRNRQRLACGHLTYIHINQPLHWSATPTQAYAYSECDCSNLLLLKVFNCSDCIEAKLSKTELKLVTTRAA